MGANDPPAEGTLARGPTTADTVLDHTVASATAAAALSVWAHAISNLHATRVLGCIFTAARVAARVPDAGLRVVGAEEGGLAAGEDVVVRIELRSPDPLGLVKYARGDVADAAGAGGGLLGRDKGCPVGVVVVAVAIEGHAVRLV